jgi:hypothetical protein
MWEQPVEEWLTPRCETAETAASETDEYENEYEEGIEEEKDLDRERASLIAVAFVQSPVAAALPKNLRKDAYVIAEDLVYESFRVLDRPPHTWDEPTLRKLLLDIIPTRLPANREILEKIVPVAEAMLYWLQFDGMLTDADTLVRAIHGWTDQVIATGIDPKRRASDKPLLVEAMEAGLDPLDPEFSRAFVERKPDKSAGALPSPPPRQDAKPEEPPIPIVEHRAKIARNAPCPCGSGKKYKKCHGRLETTGPLG